MKPSSFCQDDLPICHFLVVQRADIAFPTGVLKPLVHGIEVVILEGCLQSFALGVPYGSVYGSRNLRRGELVVLRKWRDRYNFFRRGSLGYARLHSVNGGRRSRSLVEPISQLLLSQSRILACTSPRGRFARGRQLSRSRIYWRDLMSPCRGTLRLLEADHYCLPIQSQVVTLSTARFELACTYCMALQITSDRQAEVLTYRTEHVTVCLAMAFKRDAKCLARVHWVGCCL